MPQPPVVIAGAGIAGLTAALAFARHGIRVRIHERSPVLEEVGAGLQLSPNATRLLDRLGVLDLVSTSSAVRPEAVVLRDAASLVERGRVPLGAAAERRWKAPYLVAHRADLQSALLARVSESQLISIATGATIGTAPRADGLSVSITQGGITSQQAASLFIAADGVWSASRRLVGPHEKSKFVGELAWRTTIPVGSEAGRQFAGVTSLTTVTTFLHPGFHLVAYPIRAGHAVNLVAFTPGTAISEQWSGQTDAGALRRAMQGTAPALSRLVEEAGPWTVRPLHIVDQSRPWTAPSGIVLIGDAAHAMTPFAAQGAAMAIEDAWTLADAVATAQNKAEALKQWEVVRKLRVAKVARRGALNHFAWHASGPVALARNLVLRLHSPARLAAGMDWLYGWTPPGWTPSKPPVGRL